MKDAKLYIPTLTLSAKDNQKVLTKGFERSIYWNEYKTKSGNKNTTNEYRYFLESCFLGLNRLFVLVYSNQDNNAKRFKSQRYYFNVITSRKNLYDQAIDSDIKQYESK